MSAILSCLCSVHFSGEQHPVVSFVLPNAFDRFEPLNFLETMGAVKGERHIVVAFSYEADRRITVSPRCLYLLRDERAANTLAAKLPINANAVYETVAYHLALQIDQLIENRMLRGCFVQTVIECEADGESSNVASPFGNRRALPAFGTVGAHILPATFHGRFGSSVKNRTIPEP